LVFRNSLGQLKIYSLLLGRSLSYKLTLHSNLILNKKLLIGIILIGLLIRIGYVITQKDEIYWIDGIEYHALAQQLATGNGYVTNEGIPTAFRPIGYPLFLALLFKIGGTGLLWIRLVQVILSSATILIVYALARRMMGTMPAIISAGIVAVYPYFIFIAGAILPTCWFSFLLVLGVYFIVRAKEKHGKIKIGLAGILLGLATLTLPSAAVLVLLTAFWLFAVNYSQPKRAIMRTLILGFCTSLVVVPWIYRNYAVFGKPTIATNGGRNFWLGNNPAATASSGNNVALTESLAAHLNSVQSEIEKEHIYYQEGKQFISQHPDRFIKLAMLKAINFWRLFPMPTSGYPSMENTSRWIGAFASGVLFALGLVGLITTWKSAKPEGSLLLMFFIAFTILHAIFISKVRMRLPLDHFVTIFAAYPVARTLAWFQEIICANGQVINKRGKVKSKKILAWL